MAGTSKLTPADAVGFALASYEELERQMLAFMDVVPFVGANQQVVSARLIPILMESCSLIDSILRSNAGDEQKGSLKQLAARSGLGLDGSLSALLVSPLQVLNPFRGWHETTPDWWRAYNRIKHDRIRSFDAATYPIAVSALVALHQVITRSRMFTTHLAKRGWVNEDDDVHMAELASFELVGSGPPDIPIETRLVLSPLGDNFVEWEDGRWAFSKDVRFSRRVANYIWEHEGW